MLRLHETMTAVGCRFIYIQGRCSPPPGLLELLLRCFEHLDCLLLEPEQPYGTTLTPASCRGNGHVMPIKHATIWHHTQTGQSWGNDWQGMQLMLKGPKAASSTVQDHTSELHYNFRQV